MILKITFILFIQGKYSSNTLNYIHIFTKFVTEAPIISFKMMYSKYQMNSANKLEKEYFI